MHSIGLNSSAVAVDTPPDFSLEQSSIVSKAPNSETGALKLTIPDSLPLESPQCETSDNIDNRERENNLHDTEDTETANIKAFENQENELEDTNEIIGTEDKTEGKKLSNATENQGKTPAIQFDLGSVGSMNIDPDTAPDPDEQSSYIPEGPESETEGEKDTVSPVSNPDFENVSFQAVCIVL